jgi:hypothetical protein
MARSVGIERAQSNKMKPPLPRVEFHNQCKMEIKKLNAAISGRAHRAIIGIEHFSFCIRSPLAAAGIAARSFFR